MTTYYLYVLTDDCYTYQSSNPPTNDDRESIINGDLAVFKKDLGDQKFLIHEPIDANDTDSWGIVDQKETS